VPAVSGGAGGHGHTSVKKKRKSGLFVRPDVPDARDTRDAQREDGGQTSGCTGLVLRAASRPTCELDRERRDRRDKMITRLTCGEARTHGARELFGQRPCVM